MVINLEEDLKRKLISTQNQITEALRANNPTGELVENRTSILIALEHVYKHIMYFKDMYYTFDKNKYFQQKMKEFSNNKNLKNGYCTK